MHAGAAGIRQSLLALAAVACFALLSMGASPSASQLASRLTQHAAVLGSAGRAAPASADEAARHIETALLRLGYEVSRQTSKPQGQRRQQIEVALASAAHAHLPSRVLIIGACYSPAAGDPRGAVAAVLELARLLKSVRAPDGTQLRFVFFVGGNAEPSPPDGNFIAFSGSRAESDRVRKALASFGAVSAIPTEGLASRAYVEGVTVSGTLMITDVQFLRYPYAHTAQGRGQPDYDDMAHAVDALARLLRRIAAPASM